MGMDGLSLSNTGMVKESTSAEYSNKVEQTMQADPTNNSKQIQGAGAKQRVQEKNEDSEKGKKNKQNNPNTEEFNDGYIEEPESNSETSEIDIEDLNNPNKDFYVKLNVKDDIIELYDSSTDRLVETISGNELGELVQKLNMASGIFVNKKV